ncbi:YesL family protein [Gracilibacillus sp. HCP3S3_G5_1]|uniref:YesL family protein n=1 Tax=unclassified Gracilibacillus TaxID=2625209 RepID=UPI003F8A0EAF
MQFDTSSGLFKICEWLYRLASLNVIAIGFSLLGGIVLGLFPAITAMFALNNKWIQAEEFPVIKEFWKAYKKHFVKSNLLGGLIIVTAIVLYIDFALVQNFSGILYYLILSSSSTVLILSVIVLLYVFSFMITFPELGLIKQMRRAIQLSTLFPKQTIWMGLSLVSFLFICWVIPGLSFLFLGSGLTFIAMYFSNFALQRLDYFKTQPSNKRILEERGVLHGE